MYIYIVHFITTLTEIRKYFGATNDLENIFGKLQITYLKEGKIFKVGSFDT